MKLKSFITSPAALQLNIICFIIFFLLIHSMPCNASAESQAQFGPARDLARSVLLNGAPDAAFREYLRNIEAQNPHGNIMELLFFVFKQSIEDSNDDKKAWLLKLKQQEFVKALADYLDTMTNVSQEMDKLATGSPDSSATGLFAKAEAALQQFEAKLSRSNLPYTEKEPFLAMTKQDRRLYQNARILEQNVRSDMLANKRAASKTAGSDQNSRKSSVESQGMGTRSMAASPRMLEFEAENLFKEKKTLLSGGKIGPQSMSGFGSGWSNNAQIFWSGGAPGAVLDLILDIPAAATYAVELYMTRAPDYGILKIEIDGKASAVNFHGYSPRVIGANPVQIGKFSLQAGKRKISFMIIDKYPNSTGYAAGIDRVKLYPVGPPSR